MISNFETACLCQKFDFSLLDMIKSDLDALAPCALKSSESFLGQNQF